MNVAKPIRRRTQADMQDVEGNQRSRTFKGPQDFKLKPLTPMGGPDRNSARAKQAPGGVQAAPDPLRMSVIESNPFRGLEVAGQPSMMTTARSNYLGLKIPKPTRGWMGGSKFRT